MTKDIDSFDIDSSHMKISDFLNAFPMIKAYGLNDNDTYLSDTCLTGVTSSSKDVRKGYLFVAKRGSKFDGRVYIPEAIERGAVAVLSECYTQNISVPQLVVEDLTLIEGDVCHNLNKKASDKLLMIGVTGTSGKTTTTYAIRHILEHQRQNIGLIGTVEYIMGPTRVEASRTTPDLASTHSLLHEMVKASADAAIMEVSSHALTQGRVDSVEFDIAVFTNLTHEHLDYHQTMDAYCEAKGRLFTGIKPKSISRKPHLPKVAVVNRDDLWCDKITSGLRVEKITYSLTQEADLRAHQIQMTNQGTSFEVIYKSRSYPVQIPLIGRFNIENILAALGATLAAGISIEHAIDACRTFNGPPGRLERVPNDVNLSVYVDYAHKEDALRKVLNTLRETLSSSKKGRLIVVFGCGGDRDREKRPKMGRAAEEIADVVIITSDNPRSENPLDIIDQICHGFKSPHNHIVLPDRRDAISYAIQIATSDDIVVIAGKGHEKKQEFRDHVVPFDDCQVASLATLERKK